MVESASQATSPSVLPFLHSSPVYPTHTHTHRRRPRYVRRESQLKLRVTERAYERFRRRRGKSTPHEVDVGDVTLDWDAERQRILIDDTASHVEQFARDT